MSEKNLSKTTFLVRAEILNAPQSDYKCTASTIPSTLVAQPDLLYMRSLLVSTGSNENDDVFLPEEMWNARFSPKLKFINWEHNSGREATAEEMATKPNEVVVGNQIIGVMYNSFATDENGVIISEEKAKASDFKIPDSYHIVDEGVIYKGAFPKVAARIEKGAKENNLFVSMEAYFANYDYLVGDKIVARNEETSFLDKRLKANKGNGILGQDRVRRILRGIVFGGKGIVERPANEPSVIQSVTHKPITANTINNRTIASNIIGGLNNTKEFKMDENAKKLMEDTSASLSFKDYKEVTQELAETRVELKSTASKLEVMKTELDEVKASQSQLKDTLTKGGAILEEALPGVSEKLVKANIEDVFSVVAETVKATQASADEKVAVAEKAKSEAEATLTSLQDTVRAGERLSKIQSELSLATIEGDDEDTVKAKLARATKIADQTKALNDEAFASHLEDLKGLLVIAKKGFVPFGKKDKDKDEKDMDKKDKKGKKDAKASEDADSDEGITDASILDSIKKTQASSDSDDTTAPLDLEKAFGGLISDMMSSRKENDNKTNRDN